MKNILCFDDPANLIYTATGTEILWVLDNHHLQKQILKGGAEWYALHSTGQFGKKEPSINTKKLVAIKSMNDEQMTQPWL
ncbi:MAG: hypothetical protein ACRCVN_01135 [Spirochaetia bacterium]